MTIEVQQETLIVLNLQSRSPAVCLSLSQNSTSCGVRRQEHNVPILRCPAFYSQSSCVKSLCVRPCACVLTQHVSVEVHHWNRYLFFPVHVWRCNLLHNFDRGSREKNRFAFIMPLLFQPDSGARHNKSGENR